MTLRTAALAVVALIAFTSLAVYGPAAIEALVAAAVLGS